jgi:DNA polymerase I
LRLKLRLNNEDNQAKQERVKQAVERKKAATETMEEAWQRIFAMKNTATDEQRLREVKAALESGVIGRRPDDVAKRFSKAEALRLWRDLQEMQREETLRRMVEQTPPNYWLITDERRLDELLRLLDGEDEIVFDVETTGTDVWEDYIVGHVISSVKADVHAYIPTKHETDQPQLPNELVVRKLKPYYEDAGLSKIAHNAKFDIHMLDREGVKLRGLAWDTQEAMRMLNENEPSFQLKKLVEKYLRIPSQTYEELFGKVGFHKVSDLKVALAYAAKDGDITRKLRDFQRKHLRKLPTIYDYYTTVEVPLTTTVVEMEKTGFLVDTKFAKEYERELEERLAELHAKLVRALGDINLNSPAQLKPALERVTGQKLESTDAKKVLKPLKNRYPIIADLLEYKEIMKLLSTYIRVLPELITEKTGRLHANFNQNGAKTGRFSSGGNGVNLQNQPKEARKLFVAPPGYVILGGDFSQQEYRALAYFSRDPKLLENYKQGRDLYSTIAAEVFNKPIEECGDGSIYRKQTKIILLAVVYGGGANMLKDAIGVSKQEAQAFLDSFFERFPVVAQWIEENRRFVKKHGFVWMDKQQRKRRLPHAKDRNHPQYYSSVFTQSTNAIIQGSAAIQTKVTMNKLQELCERKTAEGRGEWRLLCVVHDEALLLVPDTIMRQDVKDFENVMLYSYAFGDVPNKTDVELYKRWGEGISVEEWFKEENN